MGNIKANVRDFKSNLRTRGRDKLYLPLMRFAG